LFRHQMTDSYLGKYRIIEHIGRGGMADVYKALHTGLNRVVALKVLHRAFVHSQEMRERFRREALAIATLNHPNVVQVFDFDVSDDVYFMVMEYIEGETLAQQMARLHDRGKRVPLPKTLRTVADVGGALYYAHQQGMLHRDVKPANIMFRGDETAVLTDFGVAKILDVYSDITATGAVAGTPAYMAPEQWTDQSLDQRSDIYSLGVVLFELATGRLPFPDESAGRLMYKHISEPPPEPRAINPDIPPVLERVILQALAKAPEDRYPTAQSMVADLTPIIYETESKAPTGVFTRPPLHKRRHQQGAGPTPLDMSRRRSWFWAGASVVVILSIIAFFIASRLGDRAVADVKPDSTVTALSERLVMLEATLSVTPTPTGSPTTSLIQKSATPQSTATIAATATLVPTRVSPSPLPQPTVATRCIPTVGLQRDTNYHSLDWWNITGAPFEKEWRLRIDGDCPWPHGAVLVHTKGESFGLTTPARVEPTIEEENLILIVTLQAPSEPGDYRGTFQLYTPEGQAFGESLDISLQALDQPLGPSAAGANPVRIGGYELVEWSEDAALHLWRGQVRLWAQGGNGVYTWYRDTFDNQLDGDLLEFEWGACRDFYGSVWVVSGESRDHQGLYVPYPGACE
jgi:serine/threonine protein kinase